MAEAARSAADTTEHHTTVIWEAQRGPQTSLIACPVFEVFYGGARGGGKTDGMLGEWLSHQDLYAQNASGLMVRRTIRDLEDTIKRSKQLYLPLGAKFNETDKVWKFPNQAEIKFRYLDNDADADHYQGHSYTRVYVEEIGQFPSPVPVMKLMATLRSGVGVPCGFRATGNPGGPGHQWVKARYITPDPGGWSVLKTEFKNPFTGSSITRDRVFIPAKLKDNTYLGDEYVANLQLSGSAGLVRAWLEGDWAVVDGAYFPEWNTFRHVIQPFEIPSTWLRFRSGDWGTAHPFSVGWWAVAGDDTSIGHGRTIPRGALVRYREWYGSNGQPNVGLGMTAEEVAAGIKTRELEKLDYGVLDPRCFANDGGPSIAERMYESHKILWMKADNARVARVGAMGGWDQLRARLLGTAQRDEKSGEVLWSTGEPMIFFFSTCIDSIRTIPALPHDEKRPEDVDTSAEDHAADEVRYACMSRPYVKAVKAAREPKIISTEPGKSTVSLTELFEANERRGGGRGRIERIR
jgi:hypothetical protein